ncbi:MAG TPA: hypothetical protein VJQ79_07120, partial [Acidimicrobiia bacterium]|nr:hypothetical protein [Acidimicrobiia bacterium]
TSTLLPSLLFLVACGGSLPGSLPGASSSGSTSLSQPTDQGTTSTTKPEVTSTSAPATTLTTAASTASTTTTGTAEPGGIVGVPDSLLAAVIEDAASRQSVEVAAVTVLSGQAVDWPDGSLGCPEPGKSYTQVLTPGYLVTVDAGGVTLEYHLNRQGAFKQCSGGTYYPPSDY